ncbi:trypsin-like peptidase domain-containing protein [Streptomyces coriariae]|uniref:trypsin-like peptidase domain-containing protein n=1 Tax=Streptomyces coriariae TaxID=2864460 RepID=UPI001E5BD088|nr:trypsin-like peptidase domain-containing protein [Streptomyces coriariae]
MTAHLEGLLRDCTVLLCDVQGEPIGSGFFAAPGLVLTAAHVVGGAGEGISVRWRGSPVEVLGVEWQNPQNSPTGALWDLPDLALLRLNTDTVNDHPCVLLGDGRPGVKLLGEGYTRGLNGGFAPDSVRLEFESDRPIDGFTVFKCKDSVVDDGLSGGALLDVTSGRVVGVIKGQRTEPVALGGVAVSLAVLRDQYPDLWAANERFHYADRRWEFARLNESQTTDPAQATAAYLQLVQQAISRRPAILPPGGSRPDIHQIPSVRVLPLNARNSASGRDDGSLDEMNQRDVGFDGVIRWSPLRASWRAVVLRGLPGYGKSWLLNTHAETIAGEALDRLTGDSGDWMSVPIPIMVDCAALGRLVPARVTQDGVLDALVMSIQQETDALDATPLDAVIRLAYADGRLVSCLDALDEVGMADGEKVRQALPILVERGNRLLVTSRPYSQLRTHTSSLGGCLHAEVIGFSAGQVFAFARGWFSGDTARGEELEAELLERPELRDLARVPLLAAFLCSLAAEGDQVRVLPTTRAQIYRSVMLGALSGRWRALGQQAVDPDNPPEPKLRLNILADAVGRLGRPWRSRVDRFPRAELAAALREHPQYALAEDEAQARWWAWQTLRPAAGDGTRPAVRGTLIWEYMFDGLLAHDVSESGEPALRFVHPVLGEFCAAAYVAGLAEPELREVVEAHRWFDASWQEVWPLTADLMPEPDTLVGLLLDSSVDAWFEQTFLASRCVAAAGRRVSPQLRERVVSRVLTAARRWRSFDRDRALIHLGELVRARLVEAVEAAHTLLGDDPGVAARMKMASALAEIGDDTGLRIVRASLTDSGIPSAYRAWCARSAVVVEDTDALAALLDAIKGARTVGELKLLVSAVPVESRVGGELALRILRDQRVHGSIRAAVGSAVVHAGGEHRIRLAKEMAGTPLTAWGVRAALIAELLSVGEDDVLPLGLGLFDDPNLSAPQRVTLVEALIRRGQMAVVPRAVAMLERGDVYWDQRRRLASSVAEVGTVGVDELLRQVRSPLPIELKMRPIIALVEVGECLELAAELVADSGAPSWIRSRVATSLLQRGYLSIPHEVLDALATEADPENQFQGELITAMLARKVPGAGDAARDLLARSAASRDHSVAQGQFIADLTTAGSEGQAVLVRIAQDGDLTEEDRALAVIALGNVAPDEAARLALALSEQVSRFTDARMVLLLGDKGVVELADRLVGLLNDEPTVYGTLFRLLGSSRADRELVERLLPAGDGSTSEPAPEPRPRTKIGPDYLEGAGLVWSSNAERDYFIEWIMKQIEERVGYKISVFLTPGQLNEFGQLESTEQGIDFLATRSAGYPELVRDQLAAMQDEIRRDPSMIPNFVARDIPPLRRLSFVADTLNEWVHVTKTQGEDGSARFFGRNARTIGTEEAQALLTLACRMSPSINPYEGHLYLVKMALRDGTEATIRRMAEPARMYDLLRDFLSEANGSELLDAALARLVLAPKSEVAFFYGSLGAALLDQRQLSVRLMAMSGHHANKEQRAEGLKTLNVQAARFCWPEDFVQLLRVALDGE